MSFEAALRSSISKGRQELEKRAEELRDIARALHEQPGTGQNINRFGEKRSAPGQAPAIESGELYGNIRVENAGEGFRVTLNRKNLEYGERGVAPRPLARLSIDELKRRHA